MDVVQIIQTAGLVIGACAAIAAITPTPKDDAFFKPLVTLINILGCNVGQAKNKGGK
ncbi:hypothetical protein [Desulfovibrio gilichinskyi]|uniref:Uncharacterized protein n=1 Tax=Desulfovibrio gilichinskyi TaxID=1519643 RepID=A0A1X7C3I0_9BACT|nr:hypothetical protein [Desulfovibrio gilichinskyi]SME89353.1 hypothetical protein SAMN06295933_0280 [Desulfovibrio gilichinskyi]